MGRIILSTLAVTLAGAMLAACSTTPPPPPPQAQSAAPQTPVNAGFGNTPVNAGFGNQPVTSGFHDTQGAPTMQAIKDFAAKARPQMPYVPLFYTHGWLVGMIFSEIMERTLKAGKPLTGPNMKAALV